MCRVCRVCLCAPAVQRCRASIAAEQHSRPALKGSLSTKSWRSPTSANASVGWRPSGNEDAFGAAICRGECVAEQRMRLGCAPPHCSTTPSRPTPYLTTRPSYTCCCVDTPAVETVRAATRPSMRCTPIRSSENPNGRSAVGNAIIPPVGFNSTPTFGNTFWRQGCGESPYVTLPAISLRGHSGRSTTAPISMP